MNLSVAFDHQAFVLQRFGGISRYFAQLIELMGEFHVDVSVLAAVHQNQYLDEIAKKERTKVGIKLPRLDGKLKRIVPAFDRGAFKIASMLRRPDVVHETYYSRFRSGVGKTPVVLTVFDMIHELFPQQFGKGNSLLSAKAAAVRRADHIICISENTKADLLNTYKIDPSRVSVIYLGADGFFSQRGEGEKSTESSDEIRRPYLLYVGNRDGYKNFLGLVQAVSSSANLIRDFDIVAFGGNVFSKDELQNFERLGFHANQIRWAGGSDAVLRSYYANARAFIYPSLYEGFGIPPLEAMACSCPVAASNTSSIPEVVGNAGVYFDPNDFTSIRESIERLVYSDELIRSVIGLGTEQLSRFSWHECARQTFDVYSSLRGR